MHRCLFGLCLLLAVSVLAQVRPVELPGRAASSHPEAVDAGDYVYISGQSAQRTDSSTPSGFAEQARQALENVKAVVEASGLTMKNVVYVQIYLENVDNYPALVEVFSKYFPGMPPAGAVLGVAKLPHAAIQINAVAVRDLTGLKSVTLPNYKWNEPFSPGMLTRDRLFVSAMQGRDPATGAVPDDPAAQTDLALDGVKAVTEAAGLSLGHMVFMNPYLTLKIPPRVMNEHYARRFEFGNTPARATIEVSALPQKAQIEYTGVAVRDLSQRRSIRPKNMPPSPTASPCVFAGETLYCSAKSGFIPGPHGGVYGGTTAQQLRQTMRNQLDNLEEADMDFGQVVSTTVYLDDLMDSDAFSKVYAEYFSGTLPAQTVLQQLPAANRSSDAQGHFPDLEQLSLIAIKRHPKN
jgi:enamine deaminase RidA (YjgF/YER057c/UK114 family)